MITSHLRSSADRETASWETSSPGSLKSLELPTGLCHCRARAGRFVRNYGDPGEKTCPGESLKMGQNRATKWILGFYTLGVFLFMHIPLAVIVLFSFSDKRVLALPIWGWTSDWYRQMLRGRTPLHRADQQPQSRHHGDAPRNDPRNVGRVARSCDGSSSGATSAVLS